jgi:CelD/BcsL family acetyltransferase involved in cellulose biosynthesis
MDRWGVDTIDMEVDDEAYKYDWGEFNENRQIFQIVGRKSLRGWMEVLCEKYMVPCLRDARNCILRKKR